MGPRPSASENLRPAQHRSGAPARFNGAEAIGLGKLARWRETVTIGIQLQWGRGHRPRKTLREGPSPPGRPCFNGAEAIGLGKPTTRSTTRLSDGPGLGHQRHGFNGAEAIGLGKHNFRKWWFPAYKGFNGAEAIGLGKPRRGHGRLRSASGFNGAEAIGLGKLDIRWFESEKPKPLQWGRGHRPRKTPAVSSKMKPPIMLQWGRGHRPRKTQFRTSPSATLASLQWGRGHRPRKTRWSGGCRSRAASFNGAEAIGLGKPVARLLIQAPEMQASMGPRPSASENEDVSALIEHVHDASMGPRPSASENWRSPTWASS